MYFIQPASHIGKFDFNQRQAPSPASAGAATMAASATTVASAITVASATMVPAPTSEVPARRAQAQIHRGNNTPTVQAMGKEPPAVAFPYVKKGSSNGGSGKDLDSQVFVSGSSKQSSASSQPAGCQGISALDTQMFARFAERQGVQHYEPSERDLSGLAEVRAAGYTQDQILSAIDRAFTTRDPHAGPVRRFTYCLPILRHEVPGILRHEVPGILRHEVPGILRSTGPSAALPQPVPLGSPVAPSPAEGPVHRQAQRTPTPAAASPLSYQARQQDPTPAGSNLEDKWRTAMQRAYAKLQKTGWPVGEAFRMALRAKALRVDEAARQQGADGPSWVCEAMLIALGRKMGGNGSQAPTDGELYAYADGILARWMEQGHPHLRQKTQPAGRSPPDPRSRGTDGLPEAPAPHTPIREPKSDQELLWEELLGDLQLKMERATFDRLLKASRLLELQLCENGLTRLVVWASSPGAVEWLEHRLKPLIQRAVEQRLGQPVEITFEPMGKSLT